VGRDALNTLVRVGDGDWGRGYFALLLYKVSARSDNRVFFLFFLVTEQIRLGLSADVPLVSQQWNAIIAVNYAARKAGITRLHHNVFDAKLLCPGRQIIWCISVLCNGSCR